MPNDSNSQTYALPTYPMQRVRYYNGEFLKEGEFITDQWYHIDRKQRHDRLLHVAGVAEGLVVAVGTGGTTVTVSAGTAVDDQGHQILLAATQTLTVDATWTGTMVVEIAFSEMDDVIADQNSAVSDYTRFTQSSVAVVRLVTAPAGAHAVYLAAVTTGVNSSSQRIATGVDTIGRLYSGVSLPGPATGGTATGSLRSQGDNNPGWAQLGCALNVQGAGSFGTPSLPTSSGSYTLGTGDVAAASKVLAGNLTALISGVTPSTLYVGGDASVTGVSRLGGPTLPGGAGAYSPGAGDLATSGKVFAGNLSQLPASPPTLYVGGNEIITGATSVGTPSLPSGGYTLLPGDIGVAGKVLAGNLAALTSGLTPSTLYIGGTAIVTGNVSLGTGSTSSAHAVIGSTTFGAPALPGGFTLQNGDLASGGKAFVAGMLTVGASAAIGSPTLPSGFSTTGGDIAAGGKAFIAGALTLGASSSAHSITGSVNIGAPSLPSGFSIGNNDLVAGGKAFVAGSLTVGGDLSLNNHNLYLGAYPASTSGIVYASPPDGPLVFGNTGGALGAYRTGIRLVKTSSQYIQLPTINANVSGNSASGPNFAVGFTFWAWVYLASITDGARLLDLASSLSGDNITIQVRSGGGVEVDVNHGASQVATASTPGNTLVINQWIHVAVTQDGSGNLTIYKNCIAVTSVAGTSSSLPNNLQRNISYFGVQAASTPSANFLDGTLSQVSLWSGAHAPSLSTIGNVLGTSNTLAGSETGLVGYWKLTDTSGTDSTGSGQANRIGNVTLKGSPAPSSTSTAAASALTWDGSDNVTVGFGGGNLAIQATASVGIWTSAAPSAPVTPPTALSVFGTLAFPGLGGSDPPALITQRWVPSGQVPSDGSTAAERSELILYSGNDSGTSFGPDLITLRAPAIRLQTYTDTSVTDITNNNGSNDRLYISAAGNVGIGTASPAQKLEVSGALMVTGADINLNSASRQSIYPSGANVPTNQHLQVRSAGTGVLQLNNDNTGNVTVAAGGGSVGIGMTNPGFKLDVSGTANFSGEVTIGTDLRLGNLPMYIRGSTDQNHALVYAGGFGNSSASGGNVTQFTGTSDVDGPVLYGYGGGGLGSTKPPSGTTPKPQYALTWDSSQNVSVNGNLSFGGYLSTTQISRIAPIVIRGTGLNQASPWVVKIGSTSITSGNTSRGLTLVILKKSDHSLVSATTYDTFGSQTASNNLATALNAMVNQIGILVSYDSWESDVTSTLRTSLQSFGLTQAAYSSTSNQREPYAAIFEANEESTSINTTKAVEVLNPSTNNTSPFAEIRGFLIDGAFMATGNAPSPRVVQGVVASNGAILSGTGFTVSQNLGGSTITGMYFIIFTPAFTNVPAVTVTMIFNGTTNGGSSDINTVGYTSGSTLDGSVIAGVTSSEVEIKMGNSSDHATNRAFAFVAVGT